MGGGIGVVLKNSPHLGGARQEALPIMQYMGEIRKGVSGAIPFMAMSHNATDCPVWTNIVRRFSNHAHKCGEIQGVPATMTKKT